MTGGIHWRKVVIYTALIAVLLGANYLRLGQDVVRQDAVQRANSNAPNTEFPVLFAASEFQGTQGVSIRDIFRRGNVAVPVAKTELPKPQAPPRVDPNTIALANAQKLIDSVVLLGILGAGDSPVAVIEFDQQVKNVAQGQTVAAGFKITELTLTYLVVRNELLGLEKKIVVGE